MALRLVIPLMGLLASCTTLPPADDGFVPPRQAGDTTPLPPNPVVGLAPNVEVPPGGAVVDTPPPDIAPAAPGAAPARLPPFVATGMAPPPAITIPQLPQSPVPGPALAPQFLPGHLTPGW